MSRWPRFGGVFMAVLGITLSFAGTVSSQEPMAPRYRFASPVGCALGTDCWIFYYPDLDPGGGVRDYRCGHRTYDGLEGTVFGLRDQSAMNAGVDVVAVAAGEVIGVRNDMPDIDVNKVGGAIAVRDRECGNGVAIRHDGGMRTQYCHMRKGSIPQKKGDKVGAGEKIGEVGMSGLSAFPNLEFRVSMRNERVDPFAGQTRSNPCAIGDSAFWTDEAASLFSYQPTAVINRGFASVKPGEAEARQGLYRSSGFSGLSPVMAIWADILWVDEGDRISLQIDAPDGTALVRHSNVVRRTVVRRFFYAGKNRPPGGWRPGTYKGWVVIEKKKPQNGKSRIVVEQNATVN